MPRPYRIRKRLGDHIRRWHNYARQHFSESRIYGGGDGDPFWGSTLIRNRHAIYKKVDHHDEDAVAALDMGLCFGLVRADIQAQLGTQSLWEVGHKALTDIPILSSVYAEILRLYTNIYVMVSSSQDDVTLGRWRLPKNAIGLLNSSASHHDSQFWNTANGAHPVGDFWAGRLLINPQDSSSGPINPAIRETQNHWIPRPPKYGGDKLSFYTDHAPQG
ncbi:hypothetical protein ANO14919_001870 [Xylariales sp. No.14919]|nr:hypothetical protein ANO14919_001870 [Xylariales sp. No.14919]